jgi:hypothetical protein
MSTSPRLSNVTPIRALADVLDVVRVLPDGWIFRDLRRSKNDPEGLLGYVHADGQGYEVVWIRPEPLSELFPTLESAMRAAGARCERREPHPA